MAIYHLTTRNVSRGKGQSAVHKAAYNARTQLEDERTGRKTRDYQEEGGLMFSGIFAPKNAPAWVHDREQLWNRAEAAENRKDARVAREIEIALPHELTAEQREWLVKDFVREQFVRKGMIADVAIHAPDKEGDERNFHAHILLTTRPLEGEAFGPKNREWNSKESLQEWREAWSRTTNRYLERFGHAEQVDHRTLEAQGIEREPTIHLGPNAAAMEARGIGTERGEQLRAIHERNRERESVRQELREVEGEARQFTVPSPARAGSKAGEAVATKAADLVGDVAGKIGEKVGDLFAELLSPSRQHPAEEERQEDKKHERPLAPTPLRQMPERTAEARPEPKPEPPRVETPADLRQRLLAEADKILEQEKHRDLSEERTRSRRRGR